MRAKYPIPYGNEYIWRFGDHGRNRHISTCYYHTCLLFAALSRVNVKPWYIVKESCIFKGGKLYSTSAKIIQLNEYGCRDAPCEKSWKQGNPLSNTIKDTSTIMRNPLPKLCREGYA